MKNNYEIKINPEQLSSKKISKYRDFNALLRRFYSEEPPKRPPLFSKHRMLYVAGAIAACLGLVLYFIYGIKDNFSNLQNEYFAAQPYVNPPILNAKPQFANFKMNANRGGVYEYESGSKLNIPPAAFVDNSGNLVEGEVNIKYREFHDYVDFFLAGIPMVYDSAGVTYTLESAGMMEIYVEKNGERVNMASGKTIDVELVSNVNVPPHLEKPPGYNIYKLDEENRNWVYVNLDKMQLLEEESEESALDENDPLFPVKKQYLDKLEAIELTREREFSQIESTIPKPEEPLTPQKRNGSDEVFSFDISELEEEIALEYANAKREVEAMNEEFQSMLWQISEESDVILDQIAAPEDGSWDGMRLRKENNRDFELTLIEGNKAIKVIISPVLSGEDYLRAMSEYEAEMEIFRQAMEARETRLADQKKELETKIEAEKQKAEKEYQAQLDAYREKGQDYAAADYVIKKKVINRFRATSFGIWNCDRPVPPYVVCLKANFTDQHGNVYDNHTAYLVDKNRNTVHRFLATNGTELRFNMNSENLLWVVNENKLAVFRPEDFKRINQPKGSHQFMLDLVDREVKSEADAREILYF